LISPSLEKITVSIVPHTPTLKIVNNQNRIPNLVKIIAIAAVTLPTVLMQAQSSQAIPLDGILDSAGKSFIQNLFGGAAKKAEEPTQKPTADAKENPDAQAQDPNPTDSESISTTNK
jgi:hypothetical protein